MTNNTHFRRRAIASELVVGKNWNSAPTTEQNRWADGSRLAKIFGLPEIGGDEFAEFRPPFVGANGVPFFNQQSESPLIRRNFRR